MTIPREAGKCLAHLLISFNLCLRAYLALASLRILDIWQILKSICFHLFEKLVKTPLGKNDSGKKCEVKN